MGAGKGGTLIQSGLDPDCNSEQKNWVQLRTESARAGEKYFPAHSEQLKCTTGAAELLVDTQYSFSFIYLLGD